MQQIWFKAKKCKQQFGGFLFTEKNYKKIIIMLNSEIIFAKNYKYHETCDNTNMSV